MIQHRFDHFPVNIKIRRVTTDPEMPGVFE